MSRSESRITSKRKTKATFVPVIVDAKYEGNVGSIARCARNFGIDRMILVNPPEIGDQARAFSMHGRELLENAEILSTFEDAREEVDYMVGTSGISDSAEKCYQRNPVTPGEMVRWSRGLEGTVGLAFGREDFGLLSKELEHCDMLVTIPANPEYPILNLSHAACLIFYEIWKGTVDVETRYSRRIEGMEKETLIEHYCRLMEASSIPVHKRPISEINFRRMLSRAAPTKREFYSLMGTFSRAMDYKRKRSPYRRIEE